MPPLVRMSFPARIDAVFEDNLALLLSIPRFAQRVPLERRAALGRSRIVFFGRRATDRREADRSLLDVLVDPAGEHVVEDIARLYSIDLSEVEATPQSTLNYSFTARMHNSSPHAMSFYDNIELMLNCYAELTRERVGTGNFRMGYQRKEQQHELLLPVSMSGHARSVANAYKTLPDAVRQFPGAFVTSDYLSLDR